MSVQVKFKNHNQTFIPYPEVSISSRDLHQNYSIIPSLDATISCQESGRRSDLTDNCPRLDSQLEDLPYLTLLIAIFRQIS